MYSRLFEEYSTHSVRNRRPTSDNIIENSMESDIEIWYENESYWDQTVDVGSVNLYTKGFVICVETTIISPVFPASSTQKSDMVT